MKSDLKGDCEIVYDDFSIPSGGSEIERRADAEAADALVPPGIVPTDAAELEKLDVDGLFGFA